MQQEFVAGRNVYLDRDQQGTVRQLRHIDAPFVSKASTPQLVAADYLHQFGDLLQLPTSELDHLSLSPSAEPEDVGVELRYLGRSISSTRRPSRTTRPRWAFRSSRRGWRCRWRRRRSA